ncbi:MAG TPA: EAL domain-containing protein [Longimicrobiales bacterium]
MKVLARTRSAATRQALADAAARIGAELVHAGPETGDLSRDAVRTGANVIFLELRDTEDLARQRQAAREVGAALVLGCHSPEACRAAALVEPDEWILLPASPQEIGMRLVNAERRVRTAAGRRSEAEAAAFVRYRELLHDAATGLPTLPVLIPRVREWLEAGDELMLRYLHFVWLERIEDVYGPEKLDEVIGTVADAVREFFQDKEAGEHVLTLDHAGDEDFILITRARAATAPGEAAAGALSHEIERLVHQRLAEKHGRELASLAGLYIGTATMRRDPGIRLERLVYRAIRKAARTALDVGERERERKAERLRTMLREGAVHMEYHPIVVTQTQNVYGYEALARGEYPDLRSPELVFQIAQETNLIWEVGRLLRRLAIEGIRDRLAPDEFLFLNVDPHDFEDPTFRELGPQDLGVVDPRRIVLEITERVAITDYPRFQEHLAAFRALGFRLAVDDAGSGYAGLGSIANLAPDYIKLDISLISDIDSNFLKQNLVETMVSFAEGQGAQVVAEGVERPEELETIRQLGVHLAQGFLFKHLEKGERAAA